MLCAGHSWHILVPVASKSSIVRKSLCWAQLLITCAGHNTVFTVQHWPSRTIKVMAETSSSCHNVLTLLPHLLITCKYPEQNPWTIIMGKFFSNKMNTQKVSMLRWGDMISAVVTGVIKWARIPLFYNYFQIFTHSDLLQGTVCDCRLKGKHGVSWASILQIPLTYSWSDWKAFLGSASWVDSQAKHYFHSKVFSILVTGNRFQPKTNGCLEAFGILETIGTNNKNIFITFLSTQWLALPHTIAWLEMMKIRYFNF